MSAPKPAPAVVRFCIRARHYGQRVPGRMMNGVQLVVCDDCYNRKPLYHSPHPHGSGGDAGRVVGR